MENKALRELDERRARQGSRADGMRFAHGMFDLLALVDFASLATSVDELRQEVPGRDEAPVVLGSRQGDAPTAPQPSPSPQNVEDVTAEPVPAEAPKEVATETVEAEPELAAPADDHCAAIASASADVTDAATGTPAEAAPASEPQKASPYVLLVEEDAAWRPGELPRVAFFGYMGLLLLVLGFPVLRASVPASVLLFGMGAAGLAFATKRLLDSRRRRRLADMLAMISRFAADREVVPLAELAERTGIGWDDLAGLCEEAIRQGSLPQGRVKTLPNAAQALYLSGEAYERALSAVLASASEPRGTGLGEDVATTTADVPLAREQREVVDAFRDFGQVLAGRASQAADESARGSMEGIARRAGLIASYVEAHPELAGQLGRAVGYYLPQTAKLVASYLELERSGAEGERAREVTGELREALRMVDDGFARLQEELIEDQSIDLAGDIQVMRTMLAQDGLTKDADELRP